MGRRCKSVTVVAAVTRDDSLKKTTVLMAWEGRAERRTGSQKTGFKLMFTKASDLEGVNDWE